MILILKANQMFLKCFHDNTIIIFHDSVNIALILVPGCDFFCLKCVQFPLSFIYVIKLNKVHFSVGTVIVHFLDKPYQEINFKCHLSSVLLCK